MNDKSDRLSASEETPKKTSAGLSIVQELLVRLRSVVTTQTAGGQTNPWSRILQSLQALTSSIAKMALVALSEERSDSDSVGPFESEAVEELRNRFTELRSQLPSFGDTLFGLEELDELIHSAIDGRATAAELSQIIGWASGLCETLLWTLIEVAMDPTTSNPAVDAVVDLCESVERFIDGIADRWLGNAVFRGES